MARIFNYYFLSICFFASLCFVQFNDVQNLDQGNDPFQIDDNQPLFTYEEIVEEMKKLTDEFYDQYIQMHNMLSSPPMQHPESDEFDPARRRRRRSIDQNSYVPDFIRDGIQLISEIVPVEEEEYGTTMGNNVTKFCSTQGFIIDFIILKFNHNQYILCLVKDVVQNGTSPFYVQYGPLFDRGQHTFRLNDLARPKRILAFVNVRSSLHDKSETLVVLLVNEKRRIDEQNIKWLQIDQNNKITYENNLAGLNRILPKNVAIWEKRNILLLHDIFEGQLKLLKFVGTYFDLEEFNLPVTNDLNALCAFTINGISYLVLGYRSNMDQIPKDVTVLRYNDYATRLEITQSIQSNENVLSIEYFYIGYGINQENFLVVVEQRYIVIYKFLRSKREFLIFQRIPSDSIRHVVTYGDSKRMFVMAVVLETNDIYFITYNSLRFIFSPIIIRVYVNPMQPIYLKKVYSIKESESFFGTNTVQLMIGGMNGIRLYDIRFFHDNNLFKLWTEHLKWCHSKRTLIGDLEKSITIVEKRFHESYFKSEPLIIHGVLSVPGYTGTIVETKDYRNIKNELRINKEYFDRLKNMKNLLNTIERDIENAHRKLQRAVLVNSPQIQMITGNLSFEHLQIIQYNGNNPIRNAQQFPITLNLITDYLNGKMIRNLFAEVISIHHSLLEIRVPVSFRLVDLRYYNRKLFVFSLVNGRYNMSRIVTSIGHHQINGYKRFHRSLIVDETIYSRMVEGNVFDRNNVLLTIGEQIIRLPIQVESKKLRTNLLNVVSVNNYDFAGFLSSVVKIDEPPFPLLKMSLEFSNELIINDLVLDSGGQLNERQVDKIYDSVLWLNKPNQTILGDCFFRSNVSILANLNVRMINNRNVPNDLIVANRFETIIGSKNFVNQIYIENLNVSQTLNGLAVIDGIPDIVINDIQQNITGKKSIRNTVAVKESSNISGLLNGMSLAQLNKRSQERKQTDKYFEKLYITNMANFEGGLRFEQINSMSFKQFKQLMEDTLTLNEQEFEWNYFNVHFDRLHINKLDCSTINGINPVKDLFTRTTAQTVNIPYKFKDIQIGTTSRIEMLNNSTLIMLSNLLTNVENQTINGTKEIIGDIYVDSLHANMVNNVPLDDVIFQDQTDLTKKIEGWKVFQNNSENQLYFKNISIDDLVVDSINNVHINNLIDHSLRRHEFQNISNRFHLNGLLVSEDEEFKSPMVNGINLEWLNNDVVLAKEPEAPNRKISHQNVTAFKTFIRPVSFNEIEFRHLLNGITVYEMKNNWFVNRRQPQNVRANFSIDHLTVRNVHIHDSYLNGIKLDRLFNDVIWLDKKTSIHSQLEFRRNVQINGNILLNGQLNEIDLRRDVVLNDPNYGIQTIRGNIRFADNVTIEKDLDVNGLINNVNVNYLCSTAYKPVMERDIPLVINGNVDFWGPAYFDKINELNFKEISDRALFHDSKDEIKIGGKKMIDVLVLNGPTILNSLINDLNLEYIFEHYMSLSQDQDVEAEIILNSARFDGDVEVDQLESDSDVINGIDLGQISSHSLRIYGDQVYPGNIHFSNDVNVDLFLDAKWINGIGSDYLMQKKRTINTFSEEITFTQSLNVINNTNVVHGKKVSNVPIDKILKDVVLEHSDRNYTIYGDKVFEKVEVYILHTRPLNNVIFSRENLFLKKYDQTIRGQTNLNGDISVNKRLVLDKINNITLNKLQKRIAKKTRDNIVRTKVRIKDLNVKNVTVRSFIDNVNISILNQFSETTKYLKNLDQELRKTRGQMEILQNNLQLIGSKLLYFDLYRYVRAEELNLTSIPRPLMVSNVDSWICLFLPAKNLSILTTCNQIEVHCLNTYPYKNSSWNKLTYFNYPGTLQSIEQSENLWLIVSNIEKISVPHVRQCLEQNRNYSRRNSSGILSFLSLRFLTQSGEFRLESHVDQNSSLSGRSKHPIKQIILVLDQNPAYALVAKGNILNFVHIGHMNQVEIFFSDQQMEFGGEIRMIHRYQDNILVSIHNRRKFDSRLEIFTMEKGFRISKTSTIMNVNPNHLAMISLGNSKYVIVIAETYSKILSVFSNSNSIEFYKKQEIPVGVVKNLHVSHSIDHSWPQLFVHVCDQIIIYRLSYPEDIKFQYKIQIERGLEFMFVTRHFLFIFHEISKNQYQMMNHQMIILTPKYRNGKY